MNEKRLHKQKNAAWKNALTSGARDAIEYFMPSLAAKMDHSREVIGIRGAELPALGVGTDIDMKVLDVVFSVPVTEGEDVNVIMVIIEAQDYDEEGFAQTMFEKHLRLFYETRKPTTSLAIFTGRVTPAESSYTESIEGSKLTLKYNTFNLPDHEIGELRKDKRPFAQIVLAARMAMDAGDDDVELREKCAMNILEITKARDYTPQSRDYILDFSKDIFWLDDDRISEKVGESYQDACGICVAGNKGARA